MEKYKERKWSGEKGKKFGHAGRVNDPYEQAAGQEAAVCQECRALYQGKRWFFDEKLYARLAGAGQVRQVVCPTCRKIKDHYVEGYLTLSGEFLVQHKEEIVKLLEKEAAKVGRRSFDDRIAQMMPEGEDKLVVETTTEKLAQHLGRTIYKAYKGDLSFRWSEPSRFVRVYWSR
jgi:NMD protein affecting ribosome stability and mRNA decay